MTKNTKKGFTIVELLIVIVVIGILATIVVVTYQGVQNKARTTQAQAAAKGILDKAEAYNSEKAGYPTLEKLQTSNTASAEDYPTTAKLDDNQVKSLKGKPTADKKNYINYTVCNGDTGAYTSYLDYETKTIKHIVTGTGCGTPAEEKIK